jgi:hypothetical protein
LSKATARAYSLTSSRPLSQAKIATLEIRRAKNSGPRRSIRNNDPFDLADRLERMGEDNGTTSSGKQ